MIYTKLKRIPKELLISLFVDTFSNSEGEEEGIVIGNLVSNLISETKESERIIYAAKDNNKIVASIIFSRIYFENSNKKAFLMAPVAVLPSFQSKGIGKALILFACNELRKNAIDLICTYGDSNFYSKVGFKVISEKIIQAPMPLTYPEGWLAMSLNKSRIEPIQGKTFCVEVFYDSKYW